jgi:hypothetical protein
MLKLKTTDLLLQVLLIVAIIMAFIIGSETFEPVWLVIAYGLVQALSIIIHLLAGPRPWKSRALRKYHHIGMLLVFAALLIALFKPTVDKYDMSGFAIMIYTTIPAALLALFYTVITFIEWEKMKKATR